MFAHELRRHLIGKTNVFALLISILSLGILPAPALAQQSLRVYVLRTGDDASDLAVKQALVERGHVVDLGVRASQLDSASVRLSDYHTVVALGAREEGFTTTGLTTLSEYLQKGGGLVVDGSMMWYLGGNAATTLRLPARHCEILNRDTPETTYERVDPPDPVLHTRLDRSFNLSLTTLPWNFRTYVEVCLAPISGGRTVLTSSARGETRPRPAMVVNQPTTSSRAVAISVSLRSTELQSPMLRQAFTNAVEWSGAATQRTPLPGPSASIEPRRVYVLRSGDAEADAAVVQALSERGHQVHLGVRARQLELGAVRLTDYHVVVALGAFEEGIPTAAVNALNRYLQSPSGGGLLVDGQMIWYLGRDGATALRLPAVHCDTVANDGPAKTTFSSIGPLDPVLHRELPPSFDLSLSTLKWNFRTFGELCLRPAFGGKLMWYSRNTNDDMPRPGVVVSDSNATSRIAVFSSSFQMRELSNPNLRRLFANSVEWAGAQARPTTWSDVSDTSRRLRIYVLRSGEDASDTAIEAALKERDHEVTLGVRSDQLNTASDLNAYDAVVAAGSGQGLSQAAVNVLSRYLQGSGRVVLDGEMIWYLGLNNAAPLRLPAQHCDTRSNAVAATTYERVDPPDPLLHTGLPPTFDMDLTTLRWNFRTYLELCLNPISGGKVLFYSRQAEETLARAGVVANQPGPDSRAVQFSVAFRERELQNPNLRRLFVNAVEWAASKIEPRPQIQVSPAELSFVYSSSADAPRTQTLLVTANTLTARTFAVSATTRSGGDWLSISSASGATPGNVVVRVVPTFLPPGVYEGQITLTEPNTTLNVPVTVSVSGIAPCVYSVSPAAVSLPSSGGPGRIGVAAPPGCTWTVTSAAPWISVSSGASGAGPGTVLFTAAANTTSEARSASLTVAGQPFTVSQPGTSLSFRLDPASLAVNIAEDGAPETRVLSILSTAGGAFTAASSGGAWLSVSPAAGTAPGAVVVTVNAAGLAAGTYNGTVSIRMPNASPANQTVPVALTVTPAADTRLTLDTGTLTLTAVEAGAPQSGNVRVSGGGRSRVQFTASARSPWLSVTPDAGSVSGASPASVTVTADPRGLKAGSYTGRVEMVSGAGQTSTLEVTLTVSAARQSILLSQTGLTYTGVAQGGTVPPQTFGILNVGEGVMNWTAAPSTLSGGSWLTVSRAQGSSSADLLDVPLVEVGVNAANLRPGEYHGRITITSPTASNSPQTVSVILQVLPPGSDPGPVVRPTGLIFITPAGSSSSTAQDIAISNVTGDVRTFNSNRLTTDNASWFTHAPVQAAVPPTQPTRVSVQSATAGLGAGVRRGVLTLLFSDGAVRNVNVLSIVAPQGSVSAAKDGRQAASCPSPRLVLTHTALRQDFTVTAGQGVPIEIKAADTCGNLLMPVRGASVSVSANFSNGDARLSLVHVGGGVWTGTWRPVRASARVVVTVTAFNVEGATVQADQIDVSGVVRDTSRTPIVTAGGLVHGASFEAGVPIAPGTLVTVLGSNLADASASTDQSPLPRELNGVEVLLGGRSLPLLYVSREQLNVQVPYDLSANTRHQIAVRRGDELSVPESITVTEARPGIFTKNASGSGQGLILRPEAGNGFAEPGSAAAAGEVVTLYCTGLGAVTPTVEAGYPGPVDAPAQVPASVQVTIGGRSAEVVSVGLAAGRVGVYEVKARVPEGVAPGDAVPVTLTAAGQESRPVTMAVQ